MKAKNQLIVSLMICLLPLIFTCGFAQVEGVNAPDGSVVELGSDATVKTNALPVRFIITMNVYGTNVTGSGGGETLQGRTPLSYIQVQLLCTGGIIYDKEGGEDWITPDSNMVAQATPYIVKTNKFGWYQFEVRISSYGETTVWADIGLMTDELKIKVEEP